MRRVWRSALIGMAATCGLACSTDASTGGEGGAGGAGGSGGSGPSAVVDCAALEAAADERWGAAPSVETKLQFFDELWAAVGGKYAGFSTLPSVDWDEVRSTYRPKFEAAESYGRFFALTSQMVHQLHDLHTAVSSKAVCETPRSERPPVFVRQDYTYIAPEWSIGVCATPLDDGRLLVYRAEPDNPAGLVRGDLILGYDGVPWREIVGRLATCEIPTCGYERSAPSANDALLMSAAAFNAHLFDELDVQRHGSNETASIPTDDLLGYSTTLVCTDQLPTEQVQLPWGNTAYPPDGKDLSWGRIDGDVGYVYVYHSSDEGGRVMDAVQELMDTSGLIIDLRFHPGGGNLGEGALGLLFDSDVENVLVPQHRAPGSSYGDLEPLGEPRNIVADPAASYEGPIAILTGPKAQSVGDWTAYLFSRHPRARRFGRATSGDFGWVAGGLFEPSAPDLADDIGGVWALPEAPFMTITAGIHGDSEGHLLLRSEQIPDTEVWLTQEDAADGRDTVARAALEWIRAQNAR